MASTITAPKANRCPLPRPPPRRGPCGRGPGEAARGRRGGTRAAPSTACGGGKVPQTSPQRAGWSGAGRGRFPAPLRPPRTQGGCSRLFPGGARAALGRAASSGRGGQGEERVGPGRAVPGGLGGAAAPDTPGRERGEGSKEGASGAARRLRKPLPAVSQRWSLCFSLFPPLLRGTGLLFPTGPAAAQRPPSPSLWAPWLRPAAAWRRCASRC